MTEYLIIKIHQDGVAVRHAHCPNDEDAAMTIAERLAQAADPQEWRTIDVLRVQPVPPAPPMTPDGDAHAIETIASIDVASARSEPA